MLWKQKVRIECIGLHILQVTLATRQYVYNRCLKTAIKLPLQCYNIMQCVVWSNYIHLLVHLFNGIYIHYISPEMNTHANTRRVSDFSCLTISFHHWPHALLYWASQKKRFGADRGSVWLFIYCIDTICQALTPTPTSSKTFMCKGTVFCLLLVSVGSVLGLWICITLLL
jgi:hypothetical protein